MYGDGVASNKQDRAHDYDIAIKALPRGLPYFNYDLTWHGCMETLIYNT